MENIEILWKGKVAGSSVKSAEVPSWLHRADKIQSVIEEGWAHQCENAKKKNFPFFNGPLVRFEKFEKSEDLSLSLSQGIFYKDVVGLRAPNVSPYERGLKPRCQPNALSIFNIMLTADNKIALGLRRSGDWEISFELSGGFVRVPELEDLQRSSRNRLKEDFGVTDEEIVTLSALCLYEYKKIFETTLLMGARISLHSSELKGRGKYDELLFFNNSECGLAEFRKITDNVHPPTVNAFEIFMKLQNEFCSQKAG